jgi:Family of unknown function (DUF6091)
MTMRSPLLARWLTALTLPLLALPALAANKPVLCAWDILGKSGDVYALAQDYALAMTKQGIEYEIKSYVDERVAAEDFKTGQCAGVILTGFRARPFNASSGSLDSVGSATVVKDGRIDMGSSYEVLKKMIQVFSSPQASKLMIEGNHEIGGILPVGAAYPVVRDRSMASVKALAGKRMGTFDNDKAQHLYAQQLGAQAVSVDVTSVGAKFNNGMVDMTHLPAITYKPFELAKGIGSKGAMVRMPVMIPTIQLVLNRTMLPDGAGQASRNFWLSQYDRVMQVIAKAEAGVPANVWLDVPIESVNDYMEALRQSRVAGAEQGLYNKRTLNLIKKARCQVSPASGECASATEVQ